MPFAKVCVAISAALTLAALPPLPAGALADDSSALVAKHAAYVGHPNGTVLTYRITRTGSGDKQPAATPAPDAKDYAPDTPSTETTYRRGQQYRLVSAHGGVTEQEGFTGRAFWLANHNGYTRIAYEDAARQMLTANVIDADALANVPARSLGTRTVDGVPASVVRFTPESGFPVDVAFNGATGAYVELTFNPDDPFARATLHVDGYAEIAPGVRVPSEYHTEFAKWKLEEHAVREVTNEDLRGPVPTPKWNFATTDTTPVEVTNFTTPYPFMPTSGAVFIHASINGHEGKFLLDSGASEILVYRPYADKLNLKILGRTSFGGIAGGVVKARYARADTIAVGKNTLSNVIVTFAGGGFGDVDGIMGYDLLAGALVDVDTANQTIRILDATKMEPAIAKGAYAFTVNLAGLSPEIVLKVNGVTTHPIFDTGNSSFITLSEDLRNSGKIVALNDTIRINNQEYTYEFTSYGVDGPEQHPSKCARLNEIVIGPYRNEKVETCFASPKVFGRDGGLIGFDFLKHFNWTFDYVDSKLVLTPNGK
jgi:predicted aspartyl protease